VRGRVQRVEKVGVELIVATNQVSKTSKSVYLVPDLGWKRAIGEFFNRLVDLYSIS
jgi:hypothetical protein